VRALQSHLAEGDDLPLVLDEQDLGEQDRAALQRLWKGSMRH